jgi:maltose/maltodextrin transport system permease protein
VHPENKEYRLRLESPDTGEVLLTEPLALKRAVPLNVEVAPLDPVQAPVLAPPLPIKDIIALQKDLKLLTLVLPNRIELRMVGLREFGPVAHVYKQVAGQNPEESRHGRTGQAELQDGLL